MLNSPSVGQGIFVFSHIHIIHIIYNTIVEGHHDIYKNRKRSMRNNGF